MLVHVLLPWVADTYTSRNLLSVSMVVVIMLTSSIEGICSEVRSVLDPRCVWPSWTGNQPGPVPTLGEIQGDLRR